MDILSEKSNCVSVLHYLCQGGGGSINNPEIHKGGKKECPLKKGISGQFREMVEKGSKGNLCSKLWKINWGPKGPTLKGFGNRNDHGHIGVLGGGLKAGSTETPAEKKRIRGSESVADGSKNVLRIAVNP